MDFDLTPLVAFVVLVTSFSVSAWIYWVGLFHPTQWLSPLNKAIVITGCDSGIGLQLAKHFHHKGCFIIATVVSKQSDGALQLQNQLQGERFHLLQMDLQNRQDIAQAVANIEHILQVANLGLHALVNNAAVCVFGEFDFCTFDQMERQINVNLVGTISLTKLILPQLIKSKGRIVNVSSINAMQSFPGVGIYSATKRAIEGFGDALRMELFKFGVQVINVRCGDYARLTNIMAQHEQVVAQQEEQLTDAKRNLYGDYFHQYHKSALANYGYFSPKSFDDSSLFADFEEAIFTVKSRTYIISATLSYKLLIYFLLFLPIRPREFLIRKFTNSMINKNDKKTN